MRANKELEQEARFKKELKDISGKKFTIKGTEDIGGVEVTKIRPKHDSYYYKSEKPKTKIVIHNTVGVLRSDIASLTKKDSHVSVPYVIGRDGTIYEIFEPEYWSYHLGRGAKGGNKVNSSTSIGIELSSYGPLKEDSGNLETAYSRIPYTTKSGKSSVTKRDIYCSLSEHQYYVELNNEFRGVKYFAGYTDAQLKSLKILIEYLCERFNIPKTLLPESERYEVFKTATSAKEYTGICSHVNFRESGKWDVGPEMDWDYIVPAEHKTMNGRVYPKSVIENEVEDTYEQQEIVFEEEVEIKSNTTNKKFSVLTFVLNLASKFLKRN